VSDRPAPRSLATATRCGKSQANSTPAMLRQVQDNREDLLRRVVTVVRWVVGTILFVILAIVLVAEGQPSQRPWLALVVGLIVLGSAVAILKTRANR
jgi:hypothetical protein